jgi:ribonuclease HII
MRIAPSLSHEANLHAQGFVRIAGVDEVGRGSLAGPVVAAAVILDPARLPSDLDDSKRMTPLRRERAERAIRDSAEVGLGLASVEEIEALNILGATHLAMRRALDALPALPDHVLIDGNSFPEAWPYPPRASSEATAEPFDRRRLRRGQGVARPTHGHAGATAPRLRLGDQSGLRVRKPHRGATASRPYPTP